MTARLELIVNPFSGPASARLPRRDRAAFAAQLLTSISGVEVHATETNSPAAGADAARRAVAEGVERVVVWGGDGTVNTVAATLAGSDTCLAVVPGGSGNGLARTLDVPLAVEAALRFAVEGATRRIDLGAADGATFVNMAGIGLDAAIARRFNLSAGRRRGLHTYVRACLAEVGHQSPTTVAVTVDGHLWFEGEADLVAVANGQQYGHGARIAPSASLDDGRLDVVVVPAITVWRALRHGWRLFNGSIEAVPGVRHTHGATVVVEARSDGVTGLLAHRDGETDAVTGPVHYTVQPRRLCVVAR